MSVLPTSLRHDPDSNSAGLQAHGYRRGFVLGLTLAEVALLIIFVVMLLLVIGFERRDRVIAQLRERQRVLDQVAPSGSSVELAKLQADLQKLASLREIAQSAGHEWDEDFMELIKSVAATPRNGKVIDAARALQERERALQRAIEKLSRVGGVSDANALAKEVVDQAASMNNLRGQTEYLKQELAKVGKGGVLPPCWVTPDGKIDYLLDVVLDSRGLRVRESYPVSRQAERNLLPMPKLNASRIYSQSEFRAATAGVFAWSSRQDPECRFYVTIYDTTGAHEKLLYKQLMETVEGHFYKRLAKNAPPF